MALPLMPKATAVWLVENTVLTFEQIADFCGLHWLEVQGIADDEVAVGIVGLDPIANGQLTRGEIERCVADPEARLQMAESGVPRPQPRAKGARYTPLSKRQDRPDAIAWILKFHPEATDAQIVKLLGTTKTTINAVRERSHWNISNIKPQDPVSLGICNQAELDDVVTKAQAKLRAAEAREAKRQARAEDAAGLAASPPAVTEAPAPDLSGKASAPAAGASEPSPDQAAPGQEGEEPERKSSSGPQAPEETGIDG